MKLLHPLKAYVLIVFNELGNSNVPVKYIFAPDEEISLSLSGRSGIDFINENVEGASAVFTLESGTKDRIVTGRKGAMRYEVTVKGKASHAGSAYGEGISAIKEACTKILEIEKNSDVNGITYNCGIINGGKIPNSVPDLCSFVLDIRYRNQAEEDKANELVKHLK
jgi:glutamate carboxypeptidase